MAANQQGDSSSSAGAHRAPAITAQQSPNDDCPTSMPQMSDVCSTFQAPRCSPEVHGQCFAGQQVVAGPFLAARNETGQVPVSNETASSYSEPQSTRKTSASTSTIPVSVSVDETKPDEPVTCGECLEQFPDLQQYLDHHCESGAPTWGEDVSPGNSDNDSQLSDVETFEGKIVYQPDGSAYIIEPGDSEFSDTSDSSLDIPNQEGAIVDKRGTTVISALPQIVNAFHVSWNTVMYDPALYGRNASSYVHEKKRFTEAPVMHSYRVYDVRNKNKSAFADGREDNDAPPNRPPFPVCDYTSVPTKPILMCFICKLSFGYSKSFVTHATSEHSISMSPEEQCIMNRENSSAIIQGLGKEKEPLLSFLEPNLTNRTVCSSTKTMMTTQSAMSTSTSLPGTSTSTANFMYNQLASVAKGLYNDTQGNNAITGDMENKAGQIDQFTMPEQKTEAFNEDSNSCSSQAVATSECDTKTLVSPGRAGGSLPVSRPSSGHSESGSSHSDAVDIVSRGYLSRSPISPMAGNPFMMCPHHPDGKGGAECPKCDMILGSSRLGGHITMMHSRNSCKTLKCPKCNWHYKYQETLEIHMKEKHPDSETTCIYCLTSQPHPRLARGETYNCGYKPYRCDVCNYSTTTKGNLSIHMQSDKHLNNLNDLHNGDGRHGTQGNQEMFPQPAMDVVPPSQQPHLLPSISSAGRDPQGKPKPSWRCDVCNYETNVARNLHIHMTSEKHSHNMMLLQQNAKHMHREMHFQLGSAMHGEQLRQLHAALGLGTSDLAAAAAAASSMQPVFNPAMLMPGISNMGAPHAFNNLEATVPSNSPPSKSTETTPHDDNVKMFQCCICSVFSTETLEPLHQHMQLDRTKEGGLDVAVVVAGTYMCKLCQYKTNLKANFQLHCKTDKHLQKLQLINHIREGGPQNEWRLKYLTMTNPMQARCNACDFQSNSIHKFQLHASSQMHELNARLFLHLQASETTASTKRYYHCGLCDFNSRSRSNMIQHVKSVKHLRSEVVRQQQQQGLLPEEMTEVLTIKEYRDGERVSFDDQGKEYSGL